MVCLNIFLMWIRHKEFALFGLVLSISPVSFNKCTCNIIDDGDVCGLLEYLSNMDMHCLIYFYQLTCFPSISVLVT